ncbi:MAG: AMP-binding protein [Candidatus Dormiibacterota bacterium]
MGPAAGAARDADPSWHVHLPPGVKPASVDLVGKRSLPAAWLAAWAANPDAPVLLGPDRSGWLTAEQLEAASRRVAGRLLGAGLTPGDRILFSAGTSIDMVVAHVAALRAGLVVVPTNPAYQERELNHIVTDSDPAAALVDDAERQGWIVAAAREGIITVGPEVGLPDGGDMPIDNLEPDHPALIPYTSGTTGAPKGAVLSHANLLASSESIGLAWRWVATDRLILALPLFHGHGLCVGLYGTLLAGASAVLQPRFDVDLVLDAAAEHEATMFFGVPTMYHRLASSERVGELARLRLCVSGSAPLSAELHQQVEQLASQRVLERYGMTETLMNASNPLDGERRPGSVGVALPGVDIRLEPATGEILVRGPAVFSGYRNHPDATAAAFVDGWFRTGDVGAIGDDDYLTILGRVKELIITGGFNVFPREVEDVLASHPTVVEVAVVGVPSPEWGEVVTAFVVTSAEAPNEQELLGFAAERLAGYKCPRTVRFVPALPRNAMGKVVKQQLTAAT